MFSRSCAGHTNSTSGHQWSFLPGDRWRHVFGSRLHFYALSAIRIRRPSCYNVRAFPECSNDWLPRARWNICLLGCQVGLKSSDFTTVSLNISRLILTRQKSSAIFTMELHFYIAWKTVFCSVKIAMVFLLFGCILEQCKIYNAL